MVARSESVRTFLVMTIHQRAIAAPAPLGQATDLVDELSDFGTARLDELDRGGWLLAAFGDFCCSTGTQPTDALFMLWLTDVHESSTAPAAVDRASKALEPRA